MANKKVENKRKIITLSVQPEIHDKLRALAAAGNLSMSRLIEQLIIVAEKNCSNRK
jgi:hypothetical protein